MAQSLVLILIVSVSLTGLPFAWILRDGLGPDATESAGWEALLRTFRCLHFGPALLGLAAVWLGLRLSWSSRS